ncbi:MAG: hypothetical protein NT091_04455 [Candidatus Falkowbacteria bacterium]|nr:hypothetical protein [Candidatus Falkowbacteria bacterium]
MYKNFNDEDYDNSDHDPKNNNKEHEKPLKNNFTSFSQILLAQQELLKSQKKPKTVANEWQGLALQIIKDLGIPPNKKSSVFKLCKTRSQTVILRALNDTKELCKTGDQWKYFFKVISEIK